MVDNKRLKLPEKGGYTPKIISDKTNKLSGPGAIAKTIEAKQKAVQTEKSMLNPYVLLTIFLPKARHTPL